MELILYKNFSKRKNSTKQPGTVTRSLTVQTKQPTNLESPTFVITAPVDLDVNYCKFADHYYFVDDIVLSVKGYYEIRCSQDVLATHKSEILAYEGFIARALNRTVGIYDGNVRNNSLMPKVNISQASSSIDKIVTGTVHDDFNYTDKKWSVVFRTTNIPISSTSFDYNSDGYADHVLPVTEFKKGLAGALTSASSILVATLVHPTDYIYNVISYPFNNVDIEQADTQHIIKVGIWTLENAPTAYSPVNFMNVTKTLTAPAGLYGDWRDYSSQYTQCTMRILNQLVNIDPQWLQYPIKSKLRLDVLTGNARVTLESKASDSQSTVITIVNGNMGCSEQIVKTDMSNKVDGIISNIGNAAVSAVSHNYIGAAEGVAGLLGESASNVTQSVNGTLESHMSAIDACYIETYLYRKASCSATENVEGYPLNIHGRADNARYSWVQFFNPSIEMTGLGNDRDTVNAYLASGIYLD